MAKTNNFIYGNYNPGGFKLSKKKLKGLRPDIFSFKYFMLSERDSPFFTKQQLELGDIQPAVVVSTVPLLVACYSDNMDAVALVCLPTEYGIHKGYEVGTRLLCVNAYDGLNPGRKNIDIFEGPNSDHSYSLFGPIIADLYTDDMRRLERIKMMMPGELWNYVELLGKQYMENNPGMARNGLGNRYYDAMPITNIKFNPKLKLR